MTAVSNDPEAETGRTPFNLRASFSIEPRATGIGRGALLNIISVLACRLAYRGGETRIHFTEWTPPPATA